MQLHQLNRGVQVENTRLHVHKPSPQLWLGAEIRLGRAQQQILRAFYALDVPILTTGELLAWVYPQCSRFKNWQRQRVRKAAARWCVRVGRSDKGSGRAVLWRLKDCTEKPEPEPESKT